MLYRTSVAQLDAGLRELRHKSSALLARRLTVRVLRVAPGSFDAGAVIADHKRWLGLLVLDGFMVVDLDAGRASRSWLVGGDDLIRPWNVHELSPIRNSSCRVLTDTRLALLDGDFAARAAAIPAITRELLARAAQTTHWLLAESLISSAPTVDERLRLLFELLAERWGRVRPDGVWLDLPVTHELLGKMCGARRPSVTTALRSLRERGLVDWTRRGCWQLRCEFAAGEPRWHAASGTPHHYARVARDDRATAGAPGSLVA